MKILLASLALLCTPDEQRVEIGRVEGPNARLVLLVAGTRPGVKMKVSEDASGKLKFVAEGDFSDYRDGDRVLMYRKGADGKEAKTVWRIREDLERGGFLMTPIRVQNMIPR